MGQFRNPKRYQHVVSVEQMSGFQGRIHKPMQGTEGKWDVTMFVELS